MNTVPSGRDIAIGKRFAGTVRAKNAEARGAPFDGKNS
jgi:hypothetical protein